MPKRQRDDIEKIRYWEDESDEQTETQEAQTRRKVGGKAKEKVNSRMKVRERALKGMHS